MLCFRGHRHSRLPLLPPDEQGSVWHPGVPQWMLDLLNGSDTLEVKENVCCVSVVIAIPDFPYSHLTNKEVSGIPVYLNRCSTCLTVATRLRSRKTYAVFPWSSPFPTSPTPT